MARIVLNRGTSDNDPNADSIRTGIGQINDMTSDLFSGGSGGIPVWNVKAAPFGALGDDSTDDTVAIQAAFDAASDAGGGVVLYPYGVYRISSTINMYPGVSMWSPAGRGSIPGGAAAPQATRLRWFGATDGVMFQYDTAANSLHNTPIRGFYFDGRNVAGTAIRYYNGGTGSGNVDWGTLLEGCMVHSFTQNALQFDMGVTNGYIHHCRFDQIGGYAIYLMPGRRHILTMGGGCTYDNFLETTPNSSSGFLYADGTTSTAGQYTNICIRDFHIEVNGELKDTYAAGAEDAEKRGLFRLGVNPSYGGGSIQHTLELDRLSISIATSTLAFSVVQFTSGAGTLDNHRDSARLVFQNVVGLGTWQTTRHSKLIGNVPAANQWPHDGEDGAMQAGNVVWAPLSFGVERMVSKSQVNGNTWV